jgi:CBS domain-containing protein
LLTAGNIMAGPALCVRLHDTAARVRALLADTTHNGYPVVDGGGRLVGLILRSQLSVGLRGEGARGEGRLVDRGSNGAG